MTQANCASRSSTVTGWCACDSDSFEREMLDMTMRSYLDNIIDGS